MYVAGAARGSSPTVKEGSELKSIDEPSLTVGLLPRPPRFYE